MLKRKMVGALPMNINEIHAGFVLFFHGKTARHVLPINVQMKMRINDAQTVIFQFQIRAINK